MISASAIETIARTLQTMFASREITTSSTAAASTR